MIEKSGVEKFPLSLGLKSSWLKCLGLKSEKFMVEKFLLALGLNCLGLKLGVEKSGLKCPAIVKL